MKYDIIRRFLIHLDQAGKEETMVPEGEKDTELSAESLQGYKEKIMPVNRGTLTWDKDLIFLGRTPRGYELDFDAQAQWGCIPTVLILP